MKISAALQTQKALAEEINHLRQLEQQHGWSYRSYGGESASPDAEWKTNFDFEANHAKIIKYSKLLSKLGQAISRTNLEADLLGILDNDFADWV